MKLTLSFFALILALVSCSDSAFLRTYSDGRGVNIVYDNIDRLTGLKSATAAKKLNTEAPISIDIVDDFAIISLSPNGNLPENSKEFIGTFFDEIPNFKQGVTIWRYKPWNSWSKPILVKNISEIKDWDIQFFYWQYEDGTYGAIMPLSGNGFRTTLGQNKGQFGAKSVSYSQNEVIDKIPQMAVGFGKEPFQLFEKLYEAGLTAIGKSENLIANKTFPKQLDYIGWCTWNSSEKGKHLNEEHIIQGVKTFTDNKFPLGWLVIDDGWFNHSGQRLNSFRPDSLKFPNGFKAMNDRLKNECGIKEIGVWQTINGYWNGINPDSPLGKRYKNELFSWQQKPSPIAPDSAKQVTYHFIKPESDSLKSFYNQWHKQLKDEGFSFLKVDNQLAIERMAVDNYPIFTLSEKMHEALYESGDYYFDGAIINCMDMTAEAYLNFGSSAVARAVEDYFPADDGGIGYTMERGNAAAHLIMALYNSIYFQQMVYPDFDMFESHNPNGAFHAIARAINNGPIYVTDKPRKQDFDILNALCYSDGKLIRASKSLTPTADCLFQLQGEKPFKAFSMANETGLLGAWNMADTEFVSGTISPMDVYGLEGENFIVYEHFSKEIWEVSRDEHISFSLPRMGYQLFYIVPKKGDAVVLGLVDKYNAPGTIVSQKEESNTLKAIVADSGTFAAVMPKKPNSVLVDGKEAVFSFKDNQLTVEIRSTNVRKEHEVVINW